MKFSNIYFSFFIAFAMAGCGGSSSSSETVPVPVPEPENGDNSQPAALQTGRFVDSAVSGLQYTTASQNGLTEADGSFNYIEGETVTFSIGDIALPTIVASEILTPLSVFSTDDIGDIRVINLTRLLQSLDVDGDPGNGITLSDSSSASATGLVVDFSSPTFDDQVINLVANSGSTTTELIDGETALDHFQETLVEEGLVEIPAELPNPVVDPETPNAATHPAVGTVSEFSSFAHQVSGTLTIIDDRTLEISNFNYDGGGPSVYFYTGTDGEYRGSAGGQLIGSLLNGRTYTNETVRVALPDGLTLDDFNGVSVWCDIFSFNFGDAQF